MASQCPGDVLFYAVDGTHPRLVEHRKAGKRVVFVREGQIVMADGPLETTLLKVADVSFARGEIIAFQVESLLAAVGAAWSLGMSPEKMAMSLMKA
jgi:cyanophycin synthetase